MASGKRRQQVGSADCRQILGKVRRGVARGTAEKLFEDEHFALEITEVLKEDTVDVTVKTELLNVLEQHGSDNISPECVDAVLSRLLGILRDQYGHMECLRLLVQLLLTITTVIIQNDLLESEHCASLIAVIWDIVGQVNDVGTRRVRGSACQCLRQLEMCSPGLLSRHKDRLMQIVRDERAGVFQDYASLLSAVLGNLTQQDTERGVKHKSNVSAEQVVPPLSYLMDNAFLFTPAGLWSTVTSILHLVKTTDHVAPSIFKPLMLQNMATFDPCLLHAILYIQRELPGEILTKDEELQLLRRLTSGVNLLSIHPALRLLLLQWLKEYMQMVEDDNSSPGTSGRVAVAVQRHLHPSVFDSLDIHVDKLRVLTRNCPAEGDQKLMDNVYYLKSLALTTGNEQATVGLYRVLFTAFTHHPTQHVADAVLKITQDLVVGYPHLIPLILDFLEAVKDRIGEGSVYKATLSSLHDQVLHGGQAEVLAQFHFYLQVLSVSAKQPDIPQNKTLRFLLSLVRYAEQRGACDWGLGSAVLSICRNLLLHHSSDYLHYDLGELLFEMLTCFTDTSIRGRARLFYALLAGASDDKLREVLGTQLVGGAVLGQNISSILSGSMNQSKKAVFMEVENAGLKLQRVNLSPSFCTLETPCSEFIQTGVTGRLEDYYKRLSHLQTTLHLQLLVTLEPSAGHELISAVTVSVKSQAEAFCEVKDIHLLSLSKLGAKSVSVQLVPKVPQATVLSTRAMFCTEDNTTVSCCLQPLEVTFSDLTLPLPWQHLGLEDSKERQLIFDELWEHFTNTSSGNRSRGLESVKILKCSADKLRHVWASFQLAKGEQTVDDKFLIFLPPAYHLLLRVYTQGPNQVVSMATDFWKVLPSVSNYINTLKI